MVVWVAEFQGGVQNKIDFWPKIIILLALKRKLWLFRQLTQGRHSEFNTVIQVGDYTAEILI